LTIQGVILSRRYSGQPLHIHNANPEKQEAVAATPFVAGIDSDIVRVDVVGTVAVHGRRSL